MTHFRRWLSAAPALGLFFGSLAWGCSAAPATAGAQGGAPATGGTPTSTGGTTTTGGTTGGTSQPTGGTPSTGGVSTTGGLVGTTGGASVGGGGATMTGGAATGGASDAGTGGGSSGAGGAAAGAGGAAAGAGGGGSGAGGGSAGTTSNTGFLSEGFESGTNGQQPAGWENFLSYQKNIANPAPDGSLAVVDSTRAHTGTKSLKIHGSPAMLTRPLPSGTNKLYVRGYFYMTRQLGMNPGANHETLLGIRKASGSANDEVRFGEIKGVIGTNEVPTDDISPKMDQWGKGPVVAANQWACIEVAFIADKPQHELYAWVGDTLVHSITALDQWQNGTIKTANWMDGKFVEFIIGWHSFSSAANDIWVDDLVLSTSKIGCN